MNEKETKKEKSIDVNNILYKSVLNNKSLFLSIILLFVGFYLQDTVFTRSVADITRDIPSFVQGADGQKIFMVLLPFVTAIVIFYIAHTIDSSKIPTIELDVMHKLTGEIIESVKTTKRKVNVNEIMSQIKKISGVKNIYKVFTTYIIPAIVVIVSLIYKFLKADTKTGIIIIVMIAILILVTMKLEKSSVTEAYNAEKAHNELHDDIHEVMTNIDTVVTSDTKKKEMQNIDKMKKKTYELSYISEIKNGKTTYGLEIISLIAVVGINYMSYNLYMKEDINTTTMLTIVLLTLLFMDYYNYCVNAIKEVISTVGQYYDAQEYFSNFKIIEEDTEQEKINLKVTKGNIQFRNISLRYGDKVVFDDISLDVKGNLKVGITGPIGSGKSTLLKMLAGITNYEGDIYIDGQKLKDCTYESTAKYIAYISQHPKLFNQSILYNISYGTEQTEEQVTTKLKSLGLMEFINVFPEKLHTNVGKEGDNVSGGQKQFISFIRALVQNKSIILLDEPSSSLDQTSKQILKDLISKLEGKTILITTHDKELLSIFDHVIDNPSKKKKKKSNDYKPFMD